MRLDRRTIVVAAVSAGVAGLALPPLVEAGQQLIVPKNSVGTEQLKAGAVTRGKIKNGQVTGEKIARNAVGAIAIADGTVGTAELAAGAVALQNLTPTPGAGLSAGANQDVPAGGELAVRFDQVRYNLLAAYDASTPTRLTAPVTGIYLAEATVAWSLLGDSTARRLELRRNGGAVVAQDIRTDVNGAVRVIHTVSQLVRLAKGDYLEVYASNTSASGLQIVPIGELSPEFQMQFLSPAP